VNLSHETIENYYTTNFQLLQHFHYSLSEVESMIPWEREVYLSLLLNHLQDLKEKQQLESLRT